MGMDTSTTRIICAAGPGGVAALLPPATATAAPPVSDPFVLNATAAYWPGGRGRALTTAIHVLLLVIRIAAVPASVFVPLHPSLPPPLPRCVVAGRRHRGRRSSDRWKGCVQGATHRAIRVYWNNGRIALTHRRLVFITVTGTTIDVPLNTITGLGESKVFKGRFTAGCTHLLVRTDGGDRLLRLRRRRLAQRAGRCDRFDPRSVPSVWDTARSTCSARCWQP